jgi:hypothetical protein
MVPGGIKIGKEQLHVSAYAGGFHCIVWKNEKEMSTFCRNRRY